MRLVLTVESRVNAHNLKFGLNILVFQRNVYEWNLTEAQMNQILIWIYSTFYRASKFVTDWKIYWSEFSLKQISTYWTFYNASQVTTHQVSTNFRSILISYPGHIITWYSHQNCHLWHSYLLGKICSSMIIRHSFQHELDDMNLVCFKIWWKDESFHLAKRSR